jgi:hypothetical protein
MTRTEKKTNIGDELASLLLILSFVKYNAFCLMRDVEKKSIQSWSEKDEQEKRKKFKSSVVLPTLAVFSKHFINNLEFLNSFIREYNSFVEALSIKLDVNQFYEKVYKEFELEKDTDGCKTYSELVAKIEHLQKEILAPAAGSFSSDGVAKVPSFFIYV